MRPFPADLMRMWPISTRVNEPENDDPSIIESIEKPSISQLRMGVVGMSREWRASNSGV
jgi:hypothetical protein